jgi:hypothetical protein
LFVVAILLTGLFFFQRVLRRGTPASSLDTVQQLSLWGARKGVAAAFFSSLARRDTYSEIRLL